MFAEMPPGGLEAFSEPVETAIANHPLLLPSDVRITFALSAEGWMNRADRRRAERKFAREIDVGLDPTNTTEGHVVALIHRLHSAVELAKRNRAVEPITATLYTLMERTDRRLKDVPRACSKGCWYCCTIWTAASAPETIAFAKGFSGSRRRALLRRINDTISVVDGMSFDDRADMITLCPAVENHLCAGYALRPLVCRTAASADAGVCKRSYTELSGEDIPTPMITVAVRGLYGVALECALKRASLSAKSYEFQASLSRALNDRQLEQRWLGGEDVFAGIAEDPRTPGDEAAVDRFLSLAFG